MGQVRLAGFFACHEAEAHCDAHVASTEQQKSRPPKSRNAQPGDGFNVASQNPFRPPL
jgi:hypothetical protein